MWAIGPVVGSRFRRISEVSIVLNDRSGLALVGRVVLHGAGGPHGTDGPKLLA